MSLSELSEELAMLKSLMLQHLDEMRSTIREVQRVTQVLNDLRRPEPVVPDRQQ
jgi:hypothetical protein